jgi:hypothetical protein
MINYANNGLRSPHVKDFVRHVGSVVRRSLNGNGVIYPATPADRSAAMGLREYVLLCDTFSKRGTKNVGYRETTLYGDGYFSRDDISGRHVVIVGDVDEPSIKRRIESKGASVEFTSSIRRHSSDSYFPPNYDNRGTRHEDVMNFAENVGVQISSSLGERKLAVIGIASGGIFHGMALRDVLLMNGLDVTYAEIGKNSVRLHKPDVCGRNVLLVDDSVSTGAAYRDIVPVVKKLAARKGFRARDVKYVVGIDQVGLADFCLSEVGVDSDAEIDNLSKLLTGCI